MNKQDSKKEYRTQSSQPSNQDNPESKSQQFTGIVDKKSGHKTVSVVIERYVKHPRYQKYYKSRKKYAVHDESDKVQVGEKVTIQSTRPISKSKKFKIVNNKIN